MFRQTSLVFSYLITSATQSPNKINRRKLYCTLAGLLVIIIVVSAVVITQGNLITQKTTHTIDGETDYGSSLPLGLTYVVGERMVWETTNVIENQLITDSQNLNLTKTVRVISESNDGYQVEEKGTVVPNLIGNTPTIMLNISKASFSNNFIPDIPSIFINASANPIISTLLAQISVNVGDIWKIPVNTGNSSLGMTGEVTLRFAGIEDITVPAGTYRTMKIDITSNTINFHADSTSKIIGVDGMTLQINGTTYLEQGTCLLVRSNLTQQTNSPTNDASMLYSERTLVEHTPS